MAAPKLALQNNPNPAEYAAQVTPSDSTTLIMTRYLYVGGGTAADATIAGDVSVTMPDGTAILFTSVPPGTFLPIRCTRVRATGTTATNIVALF